MIKGIDISAYDRSNPRTKGDINWQQMKAAGAQFCYMRASFGLAQDVDFETYWADAKTIGMSRGGYGFPIIQYDLKQQMLSFISAYAGDYGELPPVLDVEKYKGIVTAEQVKWAVKYIEDKTQRKPMIYTGFYIWRDEVIGSNNSFFADYDLWIGCYTAKPMIPAPWTNWTMWQYSEKQDDQGKTGKDYGLESNDLDADYFNGSLDNFNKKYGLANLATEPAEPTEPAGNKKYLVTEVMNLRSAPIVSDDTHIGAIAKGKVIEGEETPDGNWILTTGYVCKKQGNKIFLKEQ